MHKHFQHVSWNVQTLTNASVSRARRNVNVIADQLKDVDVFFLQ